MYINLEEHPKIGMRAFKVDVAATTPVISTANAKLFLKVDLGQDKQLQSILKMVRFTIAKV